MKRFYLVDLKTAPARMEEVHPDRPPHPEHYVLYADHLAALRPQPQTAKLVEAERLAYCIRAAWVGSINGIDNDLAAQIGNLVGLFDGTYVPPASAVEPQPVEGWLTEERIREAMEWTHPSAHMTAQEAQALCRMALAALQAAPKAPTQVEGDLRQALEAAHKVFGAECDRLGEIIKKLQAAPKAQTVDEGEA